MNRPKQQHYVTRSYLEGFLQKGETRLVVYTRNRATHFRTDPKNVAKISNYYSVKREDGTFDDRVEHMLQHTVEDPGMAVVRRLLAGNYSISKDARIRLGTLLAIQEYRVPWMRDQMEAFTTGMLQRFTQSMLDEPGVAEEALDQAGLSDQRHMLDGMRKAFRDGDIFVKASPEASLQAMGHALEPLQHAYFNMGWEVLETDSIPFVTSDCPVHRYYLPIHPEIPYSGLMDFRVQVRFPLSAKKMLVLRHDRKRVERLRLLKERGRNEEAAKLIGRSSPIRQVRVSKAEVSHINGHTIAMAARYVFSPIDLPQVPGLLKGECMNVQQILTDYPGGITQFKAHYPQHPTSK